MADIMRIEWRYDGNVLAVCSEDKGISFIDVRMTKAIKNFEIHQSMY